MKVQLSKKGLTQDVENGLTRKEIAEKYGLVQGQLNKAMQMAGLKGVRAKTVKFEFVEDEEVGNEDVVESPIMEGTIPPSFNAGNGLPINTMFDRGN